MYTSLTVLVSKAFVRNTFFGSEMFQGETIVWSETSANDLLAAIKDVSTLLVCNSCLFCPGFVTVLCSCYFYTYHHETSV